MIIFSQDGLYRPDPFNGNILKPQDYPWYKDTFYHPDRPYVGDIPFDNGSTAIPYIPNVPYDFPDIPRKIREQAKQTKDLEAWNNLFRQPEKKNYKWETLPDGGSKFTLELAGRSKESVAVEIKSERWIVVSSKAVATNAAQIGGTYDIPSPDNLKLDATQLTMEHGLLTILFPVKKVEKKSITLL